MLIKYLSPFGVRKIYSKFEQTLNYEIHYRETR